MRKWMVTIILLFVLVTALVSFTGRSLRKTYSQPPSMWPKPRIADGIRRVEPGPLPFPPLAETDSLRSLKHLGSVLFFDPRLSGSGKISCGSCHNPELSWTDRSERSSGHMGLLTKRNSPTIQNVWFLEKLFWDGRSRSLEDQAFGPINSESEMHGDMPDLPRRLKKISGYAVLFDSAFGDPNITPDRITEALAAFQRTIRSAENRFDRFLQGDRRALTNKELKGLHLFRTKAKCMNCHSGPLFTDNLFHNNGFSGNDVGRYFVTHLESDRGKMKTPSLRDVAFTGPWMHDGRENDLRRIIEKYNNPAGGQTDPLLQPLNLTSREIGQLVAFLKAISAPPLPFTRPSLPD